MKPRRVGTATGIRVNGSLIIGGAILLMMVLANLVAYTTSPQLSRPDLQYEPPHARWLQRLLRTGEVRDRMTDVNGQPRYDAEVFSSRPSITGIAGTPYEYAPRALYPLSHFALESGAPAGLTADSVTGAITGAPVTPGKYKMSLTAVTSAARSVGQEYSLYVDDGYRVLGTDSRGRDVLLQLLASARYTIVPGIIAVMIGVGGGLLLGALGGFHGGGYRQVQNAITAIVQSVPSLLMIFIVGAISGYNIHVLMLLVGLILLPETANEVAERVENFRLREFVEAARELGLRDRTILWNEIIWHNTRSLLLTKVAQAFVYAILVEVTLSYLKLTDPDSPQLGSMLIEGRDAIVNQTTSALGVATLATLLVLIAGFSLTERGLLRAMERTR